VYVAKTPKSPVRIPDDLLAVQRKARHLEQQLQELLDAQADGLIASLGPDAADDQFSDGSATPTVSSVRQESRHPNAPRSRRKISLQAARRGIYKRIQDLAAVKAEELDFLDEELSTVKSIWDQTERWSAKRSALEKKIKAIEHENAGSKADTMRDEAKKLEQDIRRKEEELWALKSKHRRLMNDIADVENSVEAKISSYKMSMHLLDKEVAMFLARPPDADHLPLVDSPFVTLPPKRRTLDMATEFWQEEHTRLEEKCQEVDVDRSALEDGSVLWRTVVVKVTEFEKELPRILQRVAENGNPSELRDQMDRIIEYLEKQVELANSRRWNLLVCAIGAELEAFKQGREVLSASLGLPTEIGGGELDKHEAKRASHSEDMKELQLDDALSGRSHMAPVKPSPKFFDTDDEDPDPELLISHQDTDTD